MLALIVGKVINLTAMKYFQSRAACHHLLLITFVFVYMCVCDSGWISRCTLLSADGLFVSWGSGPLQGPVPKQYYCRLCPQLQFTANCTQKSWSDQSEYCNQSAERYIGTAVCVMLTCKKSHFCNSPLIWDSNLSSCMGVETSSDQP